MPRLPKPSITIIGTGRLGTALAIGLIRSGYRIVGLVAQHRRKAEKVSQLLRAENHSTTALVIAAKDLKRLPGSDVILICTPDDEIEGVGRVLAGSAKDATVFHTSGALSSDVLSPLSRAGLNTGSIHPLISVSDPKSGAAALRGAFFCIEGDPRAVRIARRIVSDLNGTAFSIPSKSKTLYHAAAVIASPHATALFDVAVRTLVATGLDRRKARQVLVPLLESTVHNLKTSDTAAALTGTFARGDVATVKRHLKALSGKQHRETLQIYKLLGLHALALAAKGLNPSSIKAIQKLLK
ncbi:MAG TPA: Rossmann-like and DUF2520 domain-containing protein [Pyrinomonadaceae bacterium]|nr:Rossmann-like and DUF2520 domain-containing protein [Pyrinomonadaceae bacterium]